MNSQTMIYQVMYLVLAWPGSWFVDKAGLHWGVMLASVATAIGLSVKCLINENFDLVILGQGIGAVSAATNLCCQTRLT